MLACNTEAESELVSYSANGYCTRVIKLVYIVQITIYGISNVCNIHVINDYIIAVRSATIEIRDAFSTCLYCHYVIKKKHYMKRKTFGFSPIGTRML